MPVPKIARRLTGRVQLSYVQGAVLLAGLNILYFGLTKKAWSVTTSLALSGAWLVQTLGLASPKDWYFFQHFQPELIDNPLLYYGTWLNLGLLLGVVLSMTSGKMWRWRKNRSAKRWLVGLGGGLLMGYGARMALGCKIGTLLGGIASSSLHGWVFGFFTLLGSWLGCRLFSKYLL